MNSSLPSGRIRAFRRIGLLIVSFVLGLPAAGQAAHFGPPEYWPAGPAPRGIVSADFDGDGNLDVAVVNTTASNVSVFPGDGSGGFAAPQFLATGQHPVALAVADFNLDGDPDLATADSLSNTVSLFFGAAGAAFAPRVAYPVWPGPLSLTIGPGYWGVAPGVVTASADGHTSHYEGDGSGSLFWRTTGNAGPHPCGVAALDFNGDSVEDIVVANADPAANPGSITLLAGYYEYYDRYWYYVTDVLAAPAVPQGLTTADLDGGSWPELAAVTADGILSVWIGDGQTPYAARSDVFVGAPLSGVVAADLDGDTLPDLVACGPTGALAVFRNLAGSVSLDELLQLAEPVAGVTVGDFDQDGRPDLAVALPRTDRVALFRGGTVAASPQDQPPPSAPRLSSAPNPARGPVTFTLNTTQAGPVHMEVRDVKGRLVRRLTAHPEGTRNARVVWDLTDAGGAPTASGIYFVTATGAGGRATSRVTVAR